MVDFQVFRILPPDAMRLDVGPISHSLPIGLIRRVGRRLVDATYDSTVAVSGNPMPRHHQLEAGEPDGRSQELLVAVLRECIRLRSGRKKELLR